MTPSYIVIGCKSNKKIAFICYKNTLMSRLNETIIK